MNEKRNIINSSVMIHETKATTQSYASVVVGRLKKVFFVTFKCETTDEALKLRTNFSRILV